MSVIDKNPNWEFLKIRLSSYEDVETSSSLPSWYDAWNNTGWEKIWKRFLELVNKEYEKMTDEEKSKLTILETKEKFGELRVYISGYNDEINKLINEIEHVSTYTCIKCGKQPTNKNGHTIFTTRYGWIVNLCRDCMLKKYTNEVYVEIQDHNKLRIDHFSEKGNTEVVWNPWENYKF